MDATWPHARPWCQLADVLLGVFLSGFSTACDPHVSRLPAADIAEPSAATSSNPVTDVATHPSRDAAPTDSDCRASLECSESGKCFAMAGRCMVLPPECWGGSPDELEPPDWHTHASSEILFHLISGPPGLVQKCRRMGNAACEGSKLCPVYGRCALAGLDERLDCGATRPKHCAASQNCAAEDRCRLADLSCECTHGPIRRGKAAPRCWTAAEAEANRSAGREK
jgi:hypothetical protein